jgi:hypothetical protein
MSRTLLLSLSLCLSLAAQEAPKPDAPPAPPHTRLHSNE